MRTFGFHLIIALSAVFLLSCTDQEESADRPIERDQSLERAVYRYLFGSSTGGPEHLGRKVVARFAPGDIFLKQPVQFRSSDSEQHTQIVKAIFSFVGLHVVDCESPNADCSAAIQAVSLSLRDDADGALNRFANELMFKEGKLHLDGKNLAPQKNVPLFDRALGNTCIAFFMVDDEPEPRVLNGAVINIEPSEEWRLRCTAEKALFLLGLYPTLELSDAAARIVSEVSAGSHIDKSILPDDAELALDFLYSERADDTIRASDLPSIFAEHD